MHNQNRMQASLISTPAIHTALTDEITFAIFLSQGGDYEHDGCNRGKPKGIAMPSESNPAPMAPDFFIGQTRDQGVSDWAAKRAMMGL